MVKIKEKKSIQKLQTFQNFSLKDIIIPVRKLFVNFNEQSSILNHRLLLLVDHYDLTKRQIIKFKIYICIIYFTLRI